jgi:hypothetical protein
MHGFVFDSTFIRPYSQSIEMARMDRINRYGPFGCARKPFTKKSTTLKLSGLSLY